MLCSDICDKKQEYVNFSYIQIISLSGSKRVYNSIALRDEIEIKSNTVASTYSRQKPGFAVEEDSKEIASISSRKKCALCRTLLCNNPFF